MRRVFAVLGSAIFLIVTVAEHRAAVISKKLPWCESNWRPLLPNSLRHWNQARGFPLSILICHASRVTYCGFPLR